MKKKVSEMTESELNEFFNDFNNDFSSYLNNIKKEKKMLDRYIKKLKNTPVSLRLKFYDKVYKKYNNDSYIDKEYKLGREPQNLLYDIILEFAIHNMPCIDENNGTCVYLVDDAYTIQMIYGQGSYVKFEPIDKNNLSINSIIKSDLYKYKSTYNKSETIDEYTDKWRHYELGECFGLVAYINKYENGYKNILVSELVEDDGRWYLNTNNKFNSFWLKEKINLYDIMNEWVNKNIKL